jgi:hypothetical protein
MTSHVCCRSPKRGFTLFASDTELLGQELCLQNHLCHHIDTPGEFGTTVVLLLLLLLLLFLVVAIPDPATYARGCDRLDCVLASPAVYQAVTACGYEPFNERFFSDRGYFVDMNIHQLFGNELQRLAVFTLSRCPKV